MKSARRILIHSALSCILAALASTTVAASAQSPISFTPGPQVTLYPGLISTVAGGGTATPTNGAPATGVAINPLFATTDQNGNLYYADTNACVVYEISNGTISAIAGTGTCGYNGDNVLATQADIYPFLSNVAVDTLGNVYIADAYNSIIRKVTAATGMITTVAGTITVNSGVVQRNFGSTGDNGPANLAQLSRPRGVSVDATGNLYIADTGNGEIRLVSASTGIITTVAGNGGPPPASGDGGLATLAQIGSVRAVAFDSAGNYYIPDINSCVIRKVSATTQIISLYAGNYHCGFSGDNGPATAAQLELPNSGTFDAAGNLYIADTFNAIIRKVNAATGIITTYAGIYNPLVNSSGNSVTNLPAAGDNGAADKAYFGQTYGIAIDPAGNLYVNDSFPGAIRKITPTAFPLAFPTITVGATSPAQTVTVANTGNLPLVFSGIAVSANFVQQPTGGSECSSATPLQPAQECSLHIAYAPSQAGIPLSGTVTLTDNANAQSASPQVIALTGAPALSMTSLTFTPVASATYGMPGTITVSVSSGGAPVTAGSVLFTAPGLQLGTATVNSSGTASLTTPYLPAGSYSVTAAFQASGNYAASSVQIPVSIAPAPLTVTAAAVTRPYGAANPTLSAVITGAVNNDSLTAVVTTPATSTSSPGTYAIIPSVTGAHLADYTVTPVNALLTVNKAAVLAAISSSAPNANLGSAITFTASFAPVTVIMGSNTYVSTGTPTGAVQFLNGATVLATVPLTAGTASYTASGLAAGSYSISAVYGGDANFSGATTPVLAQQVTAPGLTLTANPASLTIAAGQSGSATLSLATAGGLNGAIALACTGLPQNATCTFSPASLTATGSNTPLTTQLTIATSAQTASERPFHSPFHPTGETEIATLAGLLLLCGIGRRTRTLGRGIKLFSLFALAAALMSTTGCGGSSPKTSAAPSTSTVTVTASSGAVASQTATLSVTITH